MIASFWVGFHCRSLGSADNWMNGLWIPLLTIRERVSVASLKSNGRWGIAHRHHIMRLLTSWLWSDIVSLWELRTHMTCQLSSPNQDDRDKILVSHMGILVRGYKRGREEMRQGDYSPMAQSLSHEDLITCATYNQRMQDHNLGLRPPPSGPLPLGYNKYICLVSGGLPPIPTNDRPTYQFNPPSANTISMPPEVFNHFVSSQVCSLEIVTVRVLPLPNRSR